MSHVDEGQIHAYLDHQGEYTDPEARRTLGLHIADCGQCTALLIEVRDVRDRAEALFRQTAPLPVTPPPFEDLVRRVEARRRAAPSAPAPAAQDEAPPREEPVRAAPADEPPRREETPSDDIVWVTSSSEAPVAEPDEMPYTEAPPPSTATAEEPEEPAGAPTPVEAQAAGPDDRPQAAPSAWAPPPAEPPAPVEAGAASEAGGPAAEHPPTGPDSRAAAWSDEPTPTAEAAAQPDVEAAPDPEIRRAPAADASPVHEEPVAERSRTEAPAAEPPAPETAAADPAPPIPPEPPVRADAEPQPDAAEAPAPEAVPVPEPPPVELVFDTTPRDPFAPPPTDEPAGEAAPVDETPDPGAPAGEDHLVESISDAGRSEPEPPSAGDTTPELVAPEPAAPRPAEPDRGLIESFASSTPEFADLGTDTPEAEVDASIVPGPAAAPPRGKARAVPASSEPAAVSERAFSPVRPRLRTYASRSSTARVVALAAVLVLAVGVVLVQFRVLPMDVPLFGSGEEGGELAAAPQEPAAETGLAAARSDVAEPSPFETSRVGAREAIPESIDLPPPPEDVAIDVQQAAAGAPAVTRPVTAEVTLDAAPPGEARRAEDERAAGQAVRLPLIMIAGLTVESVTDFIADDGPAVRVVQVTDAGERITIEVILVGDPDAEGAAVSGIQTSASAGEATGLAEFGAYRITARGRLPAASLRSLLEELIQTPRAN